MRLKYLILWLFLCAGPAGAQKFKPVWSVGVNPFSAGESLSSLGPSVALRVSPGIELWSEGSFIFHNLYNIAGWDHVKGYRFIFQPRLFMGTTRRFFLAPELRIKSFSYGISLPFINESAQDTLDGYYHRANQFQIACGRGYSTIKSAAGNCSARRWLIRPSRRNSTNHAKTIARPSVATSKSTNRHCQRWRLRRRQLSNSRQVAAMIPAAAAVSTLNARPSA